MWLNLLFATALLIVIVGLWFGVYYWLNPVLDNPDGTGRVTGECKDTMEIRVKFRQNRVSRTSHWTNGCVFSVNCLSAAVDLAKGRTPEEVLDIDAYAVQKSIGELPTDHMHCATLAVATLREAVDDYMRKSTGKGSTPSWSYRFSKRHSPP